MARRRSPGSGPVQVVKKGKRKYISPATEAVEDLISKLMADQFNEGFEQQRYLAAARDEFLIATQKAAYMEGLSISAQQRRVFLAYITQVANAISKNSITSEKEIRRIRSQVYLRVIGDTTKVVRETFKKQKSVENLEILYERQLREFSQMGFSLYINDYEAIENSVGFADRLFGYSARVKAIVQPLVYKALLKAFKDAWTGVSEDAIPLRYKVLVESLIMWFKANERFPIYGGGSPSSMDASNSKAKNMPSWYVTVDFEKAFGTYSDLDRAMHFGAMTTEQVESVEFDLLLNKEISSTRTSGKFGRVASLPYTNQSLKNPTRIRYQYFQAMWAGKEYFGTTGGENLSDARLKRGEARMRIVQGANNRLTKLRSNSSFFDRSSNSSEGLMGSEEQKLIDQKNRAIEGLDAGNTDITGISTTGQREETIRRRTDFWWEIKKAPFWYFLEYGQFKYSPITPPRGLFFRFYALVRKIISMAADEVYRDVVLHFKTDKSGPTAGRKRLSAGSSVKMLRFSNVSGRTRPGGFLPNKLIKADESKIYKTALRNAEEALAVKGVFDTGGVVRQQQAYIIEASQKYSEPFRHTYNPYPEFDDFSSSYNLQYGATHGGKSAPQAEVSKAYWSTVSTIDVSISSRIAGALGL